MFQVPRKSGEGKKLGRGTVDWEGSSDPGGAMGAEAAATSYPPSQASEVYIAGTDLSRPIGAAGA